MKGWINKDRNLYILFLLISILLYLPAFNSRWTFDAVDFIYKYEKYGIKGVWYSFYESTNTFLITNHSIHFFFYKIFGLNSILHSLLSIAWHSLNALLVVKFTKIVLNYYKIEFYFFVSILYLTSPYHSEANIWGCNYHYLALNTSLLMLFILIYNYFKSYSIAHLILIIILFTISLGLHELAFLNVIVLFIFQLLYSNYRNIKNWIPILIFVPICLIVLFIRKKIGGDVIGHYGASVHLNFHFFESIEKFNKYIYKLFTISSVHPFQAKIHKGIDFINWLNIFIFPFFVFIFMKYIRDKVIFFLIFALILYLLPVLNLYFVDYLYIAGDRYCTMPLIFSSIIIVYFIFNFLNNYKLKYLTLIAFTFIQAFVLFYYNILWLNSNKIMEKIEKYKFDKKTSYYWLNLPESYKGAYMYKGGDGENPFELRLKLKNKNNIMDFTSIAGMNMTSISDKAIVEKINPNTFKVTLGQWGNWFWVGENGAYDYSNKFFSIDFDDSNHSYILKFNTNNSLKKSSLIFYNSGKLCEIRLK